MPEQEKEKESTWITESYDSFVKELGLETLAEELKVLMKLGYLRGLGDGLDRSASVVETLVGKIVGNCLDKSSLPTTYFPVKLEIDGKILTVDSPDQIPSGKDFRVIETKVNKR